MNITAEASLLVEDVAISHKQITALYTLEQTNSQNRAAKILGISVPVFHRSIKDIEEKLNMTLIETNRQGTFLTPYAREILKAYSTYESRLKNQPPPTVACSPLYAPLVQQAVLAAERDGHTVDMLVANDELIYQYLNMRLVGVVVFDDPIFATAGGDSGEKPEVLEIIKDTLIHVFKGPKYIRYKYGAQRIGFSHLDSMGVKYDIVGETRDVKQLAKSGHSFFITRSLARREGMLTTSKTDPRLLMHSIFALRVSTSEAYDAIMLRLGQLFKK